MIPFLQILPQKYVSIYFPHVPHVITVGSGRYIMLILRWMSSVALDMCRSTDMYRVLRDVALHKSEDDCLALY